MNTLTRNLFLGKTPLWVGILLLLLTACSEEEETVIPDPDFAPSSFGTFEFVAEDTLVIDSTLWSLNNGGLFRVGGSLTEDWASSGKSSVRLQGEKKYGMVLTLPEVKPGQVIQASMMREPGKSEGSMIVSSIANSDLYVQTSSPIASSSEGDRLYLNVTIPPHFEGPVRIYAFHDGSSPVCFDALTVKWSESYPYPEFDETEGLNLQIPEEELAELRVLRDSSYRVGQILPEMKRYADSRLQWQGQEMAVKSRIKGDWLDHVEGNKWSFRIKIEDDNNVLGIRTFNIQSPKTRDFLYEWLLHKLCEQEQVLTTRYHFLPVRINGESRGVYALEEHFEKQLVESQNRREGPILKFNDEAFWGNMQNVRNDIDEWQIPHLEASFIEPFRRSKTRKDSALRSQFVTASSLLRQYQTGKALAHEVFDLDKVARYYAIADLGNVRHGNTWLNMRWYYNPVICKLEPIAYDLYSEKSHPEVNPGALYLRKGSPETKMTAEELFRVAVFRDSLFVKRYHHHLNRYTSIEFLDQFYASVESELTAYEQMIRKETEFSFVKDYLYSSAEYFNQHPEKNPATPLLYEAEVAEKATLPEQSMIEPPNGVVQAWQQEKGNWQTTTLIRNSLPKSIEVVGYGKKKTQLFYLPSPISVPPFSNGSAGTAELQLPGNPTRIYFRVNGQTEVHRIKMQRWPWSTEPIFAQTVGKELKLPNGVQVQGKEIRFKAGTYTCNQTVVIPRGYHVTIEPGTTIKLSAESNFMSWSPISAEATAANPINFIGLGQNGGLTVFQAESKSTFAHVVFSKMAPLSKPSWQLTGGVTFFESEVDLSHCRFENCIGEDGLNIIRSQFNLSDCEIDVTDSDGFDADYSYGSIRNCKFVNTGNDAIDVSGGRYEIVGCTVETPGDKGLSCGENTRVTIDGLNISNASMAIACKDQSEVDGQNVQLNNCGIGLTVFRKKPEYGPGKLKLTQVSTTNVDTMHVVEKASVLWLNEEEIQGAADISNYVWY